MHSVEVIKITLAVPPAAHHLQRIESADEEGGRLSWRGGRSSGCLFLPAGKQVSSPMRLYGLCCACSCCLRRVYSCCWTASPAPSPISFCHPQKDLDPRQCWIAGSPRMLGCKCLYLGGRAESCRSLQDSPLGCQD